MDNARRRAAPMAPDDRKAAIIDSVLPLVAERGTEVTSRELAEAAGVAEGTLFRAFGDKTALVGAVAAEGLQRAARPEELLEELTGVDTSLPLERRLELVIEMGRSRTAEVTRWMSVLRQLHGGMPPSDDEATHRRMSEFRNEFMARRARQHEASVRGITAILTPDLHRLRVPVAVAVALVESAIAGTHSRLDSFLPAIPADVLADALVNGLASPEGPGSAPRRVVPPTTGPARVVPPTTIPPRTVPPQN